MGYGGPKLYTLSPHHSRSSVVVQVFKIQTRSPLHTIYGSSVALAFALELETLVASRVPRMGRPAASTANKRFAVAMAQLVTRVTDDPQDTVPRCGTCSIYALVEIVRPSILRTFESGPRDGVSEVEFNKSLQVGSDNFHAIVLCRYFCCLSIWTN